jgi:formate hydrogenlyase subunit 3/multisubunit Na+/H+ antiporter MnhD subunit
VSAPLFLLVVTGVLALSVAFLRNRPRSYIVVSAVGSALLAAFSLWITLDEPFEILGLPVKITTTWFVLGRVFILDEGNRAAVGFIYLAGAFIFGGAWVAQPNRNLYYVGLLCLGSVAASFLIQPFLYAALFLEFTAMGAILILISPENPAHRGSLRLLILYTLAMMVILFAGWMLDNLGVTSATPELAQRATMLLALGFAIIMAVPPFHLWLPTAAEKANPYGLAFVTILLQSAGLFFLLRFLDSYTWLRTVPGLFEKIRWVGIAMVCFGSMLTITQRSFSKVMAYALITDFGVMLLAVGTGKPEGYRLALGLSGVRVVNLAVWAMGSAKILDRPGEDHFKALRGAAYRSPLGAVAALIGVASMAGFPLTAGFPGRWALLSTLATMDPIAGWAIILAFLCVGAVTFRWANALIGSPPDERTKSSPLIEKLFIGGGIAMCILLGAFPQLLYPWVTEAAAGMSQLFP